MNHSTTRRNFLTTTAAASAVVSTAPLWASSTGPTKTFERTIVLTSGLPLRIAAHSQGGFVVASVREGKGLVQFLSEAGKLIRERSFPRPVRALAFDRKGQLLIGIGAEIQRLSATDFQLTESISLPKGSLVTGIVDTPTGLIAVDASQQKLWKLDRKSSSAQELSKLAPAKIPAEFFHVRLNPSGELLVGNPSRHRIETYSAEGKPLAQFGQKSRDLAGFSGCCNPVSFVVRQDGSLVTAEQGIPRVKLYSPEGEFVKLVAGPEAFADTVEAEKSVRSAACGNRGFDLASIDSDRVAILDRTAAKIQIVHV